MIQILIPSIRKDIKGVIGSIRNNTILPYEICVIRTGNSYAEAINSVILTGDWIVFAADDVRFYSQWDIEFMKCYNETRKMVIGTNDLHSPRVLMGATATHWIVKKEYFNKYTGTIDRTYPIVFNYLHNYVDAEFIETAKYRDEFVSCKNCILEHVHPSFGLAVLDEVYQKWEYSDRIDRKKFKSREHLWKK